MIWYDLFSNYILKLNNIWVIQCNLINLISLKKILEHGFI